MCQRHQIMLKSSLHGPIGRGLPIGHSIHLNYHQSIMDPKKPPMRHNRDTMDRMTILQWDVYSNCTGNVYTDFGFSNINQSQVNTYMPQ